MGEPSSSGSATAGGALIAISPDSKLVFQLKANQENRVKLYIRNISGEKVAFKVKTTMPTCYFVKPNQEVLGIDGKMGIDIALTKEETMRLLDLAAQGAPEKAVKHRFMVQNKAITTAEYDQIVDPGLPPSQKAEKFAQIWSTADTAEGKVEKARQEKMKLMLSVEFAYPGPGGAGAGAAAGTAGRGMGAAGSAAASPPEVSVSENVDILRNRLANESVLLSDVSVGPGGTRGMMSKEMILDDLDNLKQKLDAMINYTVKLTAERDSLVQTLEAAQKERGREMRAKKEGGEAAELRAQAPKKKNGQAQLSSGGLSFPILMGVILLAFLVGRFYRS